tara:strand:- start:361 stop:798 length:438 start_codon:yes stop_codon:yes gene_type:complete
MTLATKGKTMVKDILDVSAYDTKEFNRPKTIYHIEGNTVYLLNCYGVHKRKKDILIRQKGTDVMTSRKEKLMWRRFDNHLITSDLEHAKKVAVLEAQKRNDLRIQKKIEYIQKENVRLEEMKKKKFTADEIVVNDYNKDYTYGSL